MDFWLRTHHGANPLCAVINIIRKTAEIRDYEEYADRITVRSQRRERLLEPEEVVLEPELYTKVHSKYLEIETLDEHALPWQYDPVSRFYPAAFAVPTVD